MNEGFERPLSKREDSWTPAFLEDEEVETTALLVQRIESPWMVSLLRVQPSIVYGDALDGARPTEALPLSAAVQCVLQVCDVVSRAHALGWTGLAIDEHDVRVHRENDGWRASVVLPHLSPRGRSSYRSIWSESFSPVRRDLCALLGLLRDLLAGEPLYPLSGWHAFQSYRERSFAVLQQHKELASLLVLLEQNENNPAPNDVRTLAETLVPFVENSEAWSARVAAMPRACPSMMTHRWDRLVELAEHEWKHGRDKSAWTAVPFASVLHQYAIVLHAKGDAEQSLALLDRAIALDPCERFRVTRATFREAMGMREEAIEELNAVLASLRNPRYPDEDGIELEYETNELEAARALYARGVTHYRLRHWEKAQADLGDASSMAQYFFEGKMFAFVAHSARLRWKELFLVAVPAFIVSVRSCEREGLSINRRALIRALMACGRTEEAKREVDRACEQHANDEKMQRKLQRLLRLVPVEIF